MRMGSFIVISLMLAVASRGAALAEEIGEAVKIVAQDEYFSFELPIAEYKNEAGIVTIRAKGKKGSHLIGFDVKVTTQTQKGEGYGEYAAIFGFSEAPGLAFVKLLSESFRLKAPTRIKNEYVFEAVSDPAGGKDQKGSPLWYEILNLHDQENYGEWFLRINSTTSRISFGEKNIAYRESLIHSLTTP